MHFHHKINKGLGRRRKISFPARDQIKTSGDGQPSDFDNRYIAPCKLFFNRNLRNECGSHAVAYSLLYGFVAAKMCPDLHLLRINANFLQCFMDGFIGPGAKFPNDKLFGQHFLWGNRFLSRPPMIPLHRQDDFVLA